MTRFLALLQHPALPRAALYALSAALVTTALFAADSAYRFYDTKLKVAVPLPKERPIQLSEPRRIEIPAAKPQTQASNAAPEQPAQLSGPELTGVRPADDRVASGSVPIPPSGSFTQNTVGNPAPAQSAPQRKPTKASRQIEAPKQIKPQVRRAPEKQAAARAKQPANDSATPRRQAQPAGPNVYFERDTQLGFAPQLRKRTCNAAAGNMPMQCYYPRQGREKFPSKPLD